MFIEKLNYDYNIFHDRKVEENFANIKKVIISSRNSNIILVGGEEFIAEYTGKCPSNERPIIHRELRNSILKLEIDKDGHIDDSTILIKIPKKIDIEVTSLIGCCFVNNVKLNSLKVSTTLGNFEANCDIKNLDINTTFGTIKINSNVENLKVKTSNGAIDLKLSGNLRNLDVDSVSGDVKLLSKNKNLCLNLETLGGRIVSKLQNNHNSNVLINIKTIIANMFLE